VLLQRRRPPLLAPCCIGERVRQSIFFFFPDQCCGSPDSCAYCTRAAPLFGLYRLHSQLSCRQWAFIPCAAAAYYLPVSPEHSVRRSPCLGHHDEVKRYVPHLESTPPRCQGFAGQHPSHPSPMRPVSTAAAIIACADSPSSTQVTSSHGVGALRRPLDTT
jgi:hypothetical protein